MLLFSRWVVSDSFVTPWTVAHQAPLSMGILQARIQGWVVISFSRDLPNPGVKTESPALAGRFFTTEPPGKPLYYLLGNNNENCPSILPNKIIVLGSGFRDQGFLPSPRGISVFRRVWKMGEPVCSYRCSHRYSRWDIGTPKGTHSHFPSCLQYFSRVAGKAS